MAPIWGERRFLCCFWVGRLVAGLGWSFGALILFPLGFAFVYSFFFRGFGLKRLGERSLAGGDCSRNLRMRDGDSETPRQVELVIRVNIEFWCSVNCLFLSEFGDVRVVRYLVIDVCLWSRVYCPRLVFLNSAPKNPLTQTRSANQSAEISRCRGGIAESRPFVLHPPAITPS